MSTQSNGNNNTFKIRFSIGSKLVGLIASLLIISIVGLTFISTRLFIDDNTALIQQINLDSATNLATQTKEIFLNLTEKIKVIGKTILTKNNDQNLIQDFWSQDKDFIGVALYEKNQNQIINSGSLVSPEWKKNFDQDETKFKEILSQTKNLNLDKSFQGEVQIVPTQISDNSQGLIIAIPFITNDSNQTTHVLAGIIRQNKITKIFSESDVTTNFLIDSKGNLLAHPDVNKITSHENLASYPIVSKLLEGKFNNGQTKYTDPSTNEVKLGAYKMIGFGGLSVVSEVPEAKAFEAAKKVVYRSVLVALIILSLAFFIGFYFSTTITKPILILVNAAKRIAQGDFKINLTPKTKDEIAHLSLTFNDMAKGLEERDRVKETFNKFHNKEIAEKLLSGEVKLGGERKEAVIFFSDVRGFTGMSESMQPEEVVEMLNEYMTKMVAVITHHQGVVDKYVGDAIMALWGVPFSKGDDVYNAVKACIDMRIELAKLNEVRISRGQVPLKIGMGLNMGQVIAGNIGSEMKMEYTVIGDAVNTASRIESMTKEYGTDLLVSEAIYEKLKDKIIFEKTHAMKVKGKSDALVVYKVNGYYNENGEPVIVQTPYSSYQAEKSDKVVHSPETASKSHEVETSSNHNTHESNSDSERESSDDNEVEPNVFIEPQKYNKDNEPKPNVFINPNNNFTSKNDNIESNTSIALEVIERSSLVQNENSDKPIAVEPFVVQAESINKTIEPLEIQTKNNDINNNEPFIITPLELISKDELGNNHDNQKDTATYHQENQTTKQTFTKEVFTSNQDTQNAQDKEKTNTEISEKERAEIFARLMNTVLIVTTEFRARIEKSIYSYYFKVENEVFGPFTYDEILSGLKDNELSPHMLISTNTQGPWVKLIEHEHFLSLNEEKQAA